MMIPNQQNTSAIKLYPLVEKFLSSYVRAMHAGESAPSAAKIQVNVIIGALAYVYERFRNIVDYKDDHLLRKNAIQRILKRRIYPGVESQEIARPLTYELIRGGYLKNNTVPETKILEIEQVLSKYFFLLEKINETDPRAYNRSNIDWLWSAAAAEIEDLLLPKDRERALLQFMLQTVSNKVHFVDLRVSELEKDYLLFVANLRSLWKADMGIIRYEMIRKMWPEWSSPSEQNLENYAREFEKIIKMIESIAVKPVGEKMLRIFRQHTVFFDILRDVLLEKPELARTAFRPEEAFFSEIRKSCDSRYHESRSKLRRSMVRSVIYIFLTKMVLAVLLEVPFDIYIAHEFRYIPVTINVLFPPLLMFFLGATVRVPSKKNTEKIVDGLREIIFKSPEEQGKIVMQTVVRRSPIVTFIFNIIYAVVFVGVLGLIIYGLRRLEFNIASGAIFIVFLSLISFFGVRIRQSAHELIVIRSSGNIITLIFDLLFLPIVRLGRWLSLKSVKINFFIFIFDVIIEAPFKALIESLEDFVNFFKEKKEELY
ncbi:MAG: hypothetical protein PHW53_02695 [Patescibacteria group bacterium]|nr:hypothetical protein [Patescibacteria group bacterium]